MKLRTYKIIWTKNGFEDTASIQAKSVEDAAQTAALNADNGEIFAVDTGTKGYFFRKGAMGFLPLSVKAAALEVAMHA